MNHKLIVSLFIVSLLTTFTFNYISYKIFKEKPLLFKSKKTDNEIVIVSNTEKDFSGYCDREMAYMYTKVCDYGYIEGCQN